MNLTCELAKNLLRNQTFSPSSDWVRCKNTHNKYKLEIGLLDSQGARINGMFLDCFILNSQRPTFSKFVFSVNQRSACGVNRVYQLDVRTPKDPRNKHSLQHEHIGDKRVDLSIELLDYAQCMSHFIKMTNVKFEEIPSNPLEFKLE